MSLSDYTENSLGQNLYFVGFYKLKGVNKSEVIVFNKLLLNKALCMYVCIYKHSNVICMCDSPGRTKAYLKKESLKVDCKLPGVWSSFQRACQRHLCAALPTLAARAFLQVSFLSNGASVVMPGRQSWCKMIAHCESHLPFSNI